MLSAWLKSNLLQVFTILIGVALIAGQYQARQDYAAVDAQRNALRIERLEDLAAQERTRLDSVYLRRDLSDEQLRAIVQKLDVIDKRIERIEVRSR